MLPMVILYIFQIFFLIIKGNVLNDESLDARQKNPFSKQASMREFGACENVRIDHRC
jgi:hypothetical protein